MICGKIQIFPQKSRKELYGYIYITCKKSYIFIIEDYKSYYIEEAPNIDEVVRRANAEIQMENRNLQAINIQLHEKYHTISLKVIDFLFYLIFYFLCYRLYT